MRVHIPGMTESTHRGLNIDVQGAEVPVAKTTCDVGENMLATREPVTIKACIPDKTGANQWSDVDGLVAFPRACTRSVRRVTQLDRNLRE